ncbi:hypothetical protein BCR42DRAFT_408922 [Absidia repens]|uniref:SET domain-containing protein n=1 Tax=Absidia repens TaxID=90262 RepID=A0A1X2IQF4_9FUNG|nr:hypothetical protein BCR42DRAFT_408922 [Absidia repens]
MFAFLSYLRQIRQPAQQQEPKCSFTHGNKDSFQSDSNSNNHTKNSEELNTTSDCYPNRSKIAGAKRSLESGHMDIIDAKRKPTAASTTISELPSTLASPAPSTSPSTPAAPTQASVVPPNQQTTTTSMTPSSSTITPRIPQVTGRMDQLPSSYRSTLAMKATPGNSTVSTRHKTYKKEQPSIRTSPYWHKQRRLIFLALKNHPDHAMARADLTAAAVDLDVSISKARNLPLVFRSKTPRNSASAVLTNHDGRNFQSFRPCGSRSLHFRLAFKPANFDEAVTLYQSWMETLITQDWPLCFGNLRQLPTITSLPHQPPADIDQPTVISVKKPHRDHSSSVTSVLESSTDSWSSPPPLFTSSNTEFDHFLATRKQERQLLHLLNHDDDRNKENQDHPHLLLNTLQDQAIAVSTTVVAPVAENNTTFDTVHEDVDQNGDDDERIKQQQQRNSISETIQWTIRGDPFACHGQPDIPICWQDIVRVERKFATNENDGKGKGGDLGSGLSVFAQRRLPANTPIGLYFGTPTTEEEFDAYKENYIQAIKYCVMYDDTVLDATDDCGTPFTDPAKEHTEMYCPFHFMRRVQSPQSANVLLLRGNVYNQVICWTKQAIEQNEELTICLDRTY